MTQVYILKVCSWGDFDILRTRNLSAHPNEDAAMEAGFRMGLLNGMPDDGDEKWFEVEKVAFYS